ncbi:MAG: hypothetical protein KAY65_04260, partial [Planctomycetes bacterium]|nr:hypothetical protein [Planctomycetota bacterium]
MKKIIVSLASVALMLGLVEPVSAFSGAGSGTGGDPYIITNASGAYVTARNYTGGLVGKINSLMSDCNSLLITVYGTDYVGGLAGHCKSVSNCASSGLVQANASVGGLVGTANGLIENSHSQPGVLVLQRYLRC